VPRFQADGDARDRATSLGASGRGEASFGFTPALWFIGYRKAAIKAEVTFAIARLKLAAGAIIFDLRPRTSVQEPCLSDQHRGTRRCAAVTA
jgi:hypothetical protein